MRIIRIFPAICQLPREEYSKYSSTTAIFEWRVRSYSWNIFYDTKRITWIDITDILLKNWILNKNSNVRIFVDTTMKDLWKWYYGQYDSDWNNVVIININNITKMSNYTEFDSWKFLAACFAQEICHCTECWKNESLSECASKTNHWGWIFLSPFNRFFADIL